MKAIKLQQFTTGDKESVYLDRKKYKITLGNGHIELLTDKRNVTAFLTETNHFFNEKLHELNFIYVEAFGQYRIAWFYFDNSTIKKGMELQTTNNLRSIDQAFNLIVSRGGWANGNHLVFNHFCNIIEPLLSLLQQLGTLYKSKGHTDKIYKINFLIVQIKMIENELKIYPKTNDQLLKKLKELL